LPDYSDVETKSTVEQGVAAARRALAIDSTLADAYVAIGLSEEKLWHSAGAEEAFRHALALDPNSATGRHWHSLALAHGGRFDEARAEIARARDLEPASLIINANVARMFNLSRQYDEAIRAARRTIDLDSSFSVAHEHLATALAHQRKFDESIAEYQRRIALAGGRPTQQLGMLGATLAAAGRTAEARAILDEIVGRSKTEPISHAGLAMLYSGLGDHAKAIAELQLAVDNYDALLQLGNRDARFDVLRADPAGAALFKRIESR
jgi:serine/threonine-protein kinase